MSQSLRTVEIGKALFKAQLDVFAEQLHGLGTLTFRHGIENPPMKTVHLGNQRQCMVLARERKDAQEKAGGIEDFQHPLVACGLEEEGVKTQIAGDESLEFIAFQRPFGGPFQLGSDGPELLDQCFERLEHAGAETLRGDFADGVNLQSLAQFIKVDDVLPGGFGDDGAAAGLLKHAFGDELAESLAHRGAADTDLGGERDFRERGACREGATGDMGQDMLAGESESAAIAREWPWMAGAGLQNSHCIQQHTNVCKKDRT